MSNQQPVFSVIIPTYNRSAMLEEAIGSVLAQHFTSYEIIIVNDGSTDNTSEMLEQYSGLPCVHVIESSNEGAENARNKGIENAHGIYIAFLDSDDKLSPFALTQYHRILLKTDAGLLIARGCAFSHNTDVKHSAPVSAPVKATYSLFRDYLSKQCSIWLSTSFIVIKRAAVVQGDIRFTAGTFPVDDLDYLLRAGTVSPCCVIHDPSTVYYRLHTSNSIKDIPKNIVKLSTVLIFEKNNSYPGGNKRKFERLALIGGHIQDWGRRAIGTGKYKIAFILLIRGIPALVALAIKKTVSLFFPQKTFSIEL